MAAKEHTFSAEESTLCEKCSVLRINDRELAGHRTLDDDGEKVLGFRGAAEPFRMLSLDYTYPDLLPDLPYMRASAEAGCAFCAMLRSAALEKNNAEPAQVTFILSYYWRFEETPRHWVCRLRASMRVKDGEGFYVSSAGNFDVDCKEGK